MYALFQSLFVVLTSASTTSVGYAQSTVYYQFDKRPALYQPLHLLDGVERTVWCTESADSLNQSLSIGFKQTATVDEIRIFTGNGFSEKTFEKFARAKKFHFRFEGGGKTIEVANVRDMQAIALSTPIVAADLYIEILDQFPGSEEGMPVCVSDIVFYSNGKPLNGKWLTPKLKYNRAQSRVLGTWFGGFEGAPDRFLTFFMDGTFRYEFAPFDRSKEKGTAFRGRYRATSERLVLDLPGDKQAVLRYRKLAKSDGQALILEGKAPSNLIGDYRDFR